MVKAISVIFLIICATSAWGRSIIMDAGFGYYKDRSEESVVEELKANDYDDVRFVCTSESAINGKLVKALKDAKIMVWMQTFANGVYSTADLPEGWEAWKMKQKKGSTIGYTYLCENNPDYRKWKKKQLTTALNKHNFNGIDLAEAFLPAYNGPDNDAYACLCDCCIASFKKMYPDVESIPDFENPSSPHYWKTDATLYEKWVAFRVAAVVEFLDDLVNSKDGIREMCPNVQVATWSLGLDVPQQLQQVREWYGLDATAIVRRVKPDQHVIQTDWPDWIKANLPADYALKYKPIADSIKEISPSTTLMLQTDIGSQKQNRQTRNWIAKVEEAAKKIGCQGAFHYEYFLGDYIYTEAPKVVRAVAEQNGVKLIFNKRLDTVSASNISNYAISTGNIDFAKSDGNIVHLSVSDMGSGAFVTVSNISDDESRRFYHDKPACVMTETIRIAVEDMPLQADRQNGNF